MSSELIASDHPRQARATRAKETTSGVSHSFSLPNYLPDLNTPSFASGHRPLSAPRADVKRGCARDNVYSDHRLLIGSNSPRGPRGVKNYGRTTPEVTDDQLTNRPTTNARVGLLLLLLFLAWHCTTAPVSLLSVHAQCRLAKIAMTFVYIFPNIANPDL